LKDNDKIGLEIGNPYLIDYIKDKLKKLNHITDGSFSPELIKLTPEAFVALFESYVPNESKSEILKILISIGANEDTSLKGALKGIFKKLGSKIADKVGEEIGENIVDYLSLFFKTDRMNLIKEKFIGIF
jgi:hypothetical protein